MRPSRSVKENATQRQQKARARGFPGNTERLHDALVAAARDVDAAHAAVERAGDADLDESEETFRVATDEYDRVWVNIDAAERSADLTTRAPSMYGAVARGSLRSDLTYRPDMPEVSFFRDAFRVHFHHDPLAGERIARNAHEQADEIRGRYGSEAQFRDVGTSAFAGLTVPQYLVDLVAPLARAGSPLLNALPNKSPLPDDGLTLNISRITTGTGVAAQASENAAVQETDADDTLLTVNIRTYAGQQDVSRQAIERADVDKVIFSDLSRAYMTAVDSAVWLRAQGVGGDRAHRLPDPRAVHARRDRASAPLDAQGSAWVPAAPDDRTSRPQLGRRGCHLQPGG